MTEDNINRITSTISGMFMLGIMVYFMLSLRKSSIALANNPKATANQKTAWDKLLIVSKFMGGLAALIFSITNFIKLFK